MLGHVGGFETQTCRERPPEPPLEKPRLGGLAPWRARQVERFIDENLSAALTVARIATFSGVGPGYFGRACKDTFGLAPRALITQKRLARAKVLMTTTDEPLNQIALACGFADQSHFTNRFRRVEGMTPTVWRRSNRAA